MLIRTAKFLVPLLCMAAIALTAQSAETEPKREVRSTWVSPIDASYPNSGSLRSESGLKALATQYLDQMKEAGINCIYFHARPTADRTYQNNKWTDPKTGTEYTVYEPTCTYMCSDSKRGGNMAWDPLQFWIEECHKRGMELHAWVNPYRFYTGKSTAANYFGYTSSLDKSVVDKGWLISWLQSDGNTKWTFDPSRDETNSRLTTVARVLTGNYDIDGIVFDDYFYPDNIPETSDAGDYTRYQAYKNAGGTLSMGDWRRENVNKMVRLVEQAIHDIKPWVKFGIGPAGAASKGWKSTDGIPKLSEYCRASDWQYDQIYSDPLAWLRNGSVDYISPQLYWKTTHSTNPFGPMTEWWSIVAQKFGRHHYPSASCSYISASDGNGATTDNLDEMLSQARLSRSNNKDGNNGMVFYAIKSVVYAKTGQTPLYKRLGEVYKFPAVAPEVTWRNGTDPGQVESLEVNTSNYRLRWKPKTGLRFVVYAIPLSVTARAAASEKGGYQAQYILDVPYNDCNLNTAGSYCYIQLPEDKRSGYWYAVAPLDRYGHEWPSTAFGAPMPDAQVSLTSPANGTQFTEADNISFAWTGTSGATFTFQASRQQDFATTVYTKNTTATSLTVSGETLGGGQIYWRVSAQMSGYNPAVSASRYINVAKRPLPQPELYMPADGSVITADINFVVKSVDADQYILEVSTSPTFESVYYTTDNRWADEKDGNGVVWKQRTVSMATFQNSTYYWRVRALKEGYDESHSQVWSFTVGEGDVTSNYVPYREDDTYAQQTLNSNTLYLSNLWLRNADHNPFGADNHNELHRDMCARAADQSQPRDLIYVVGRGSASSSASCYLMRFDARNGEQLDNLRLTFDSNFSLAYYPNNGVLTDDYNNLLVHNLALANGAVSVAHVDPATGAAKTIFKMTPGYRVDHLDVVGQASRERNTKYWVFTAGSAGSGDAKTSYVTRYTIENADVVNEEKMTLADYHGNAVIVHALDQDMFYVEGSAQQPMLYQFNGSKLGTLSRVGQTDTRTQPNGLFVFNHSGSQFVVASDWTTLDGGSQWHIASGNFAGSVNVVQHHWTVPQSVLGLNKMVSGDYNRPVDVLQYDATGTATTLATARSGQQPATTVIYTYSPDDGMAAYALTNRLVTGADDIFAPGAEVGDTAAESTPAEYYTLTGVRVCGKPAPGLYLVRRNGTVTKTLLR